MKAVTAGGQPVARVEIEPSGNVVIVIGQPGDGAGNNTITSTNEWDEVLKNHDTN